MEHCGLVQCNDDFTKAELKARNWRSLSRGSVASERQNKKWNLSLLLLLSPVLWLHKFVFPLSVSIFLIWVRFHLSTEEVTCFFFEMPYNKSFNLVGHTIFVTSNRIYNCSMKVVLDKPHIHPQWGCIPIKPYKQ